MEKHFIKVKCKICGRIGDGKKYNGNDLRDAALAAWSERAAAWAAAWAAAYDFACDAPMNQQSNRLYRMILKGKNKC